MSLFGTVFMGQTIQIIDVLALDNLFMGTLCAAAHPTRTTDASSTLMTLTCALHFFVDKLFPCDYRVTIAFYNEFSIWNSMCLLEQGDNT